jgi:putative hemolysin
VMVPRNEIFALPAQMGLQEAMHQLLHEAYSRVPIYDGTLDTITGILLHKDLLRRVAEQPSDAPISHLAKPPLFVPETKAMDELLHELRRRRTHMAIVVDEYGTTAGIVTIEDLLEELVGDIADEHDIDERELIQPHPQGGWIVQARITIAQLEEELSIQFPHQTAYDTLAGYLVHRIGSIPRKGFHLQLEQFDLEILASTARSIDVVRIVPRPTEE